MIMKCGRLAECISEERMASWEWFGTSSGDRHSREQGRFLLVRIRGDAGHHFWRGRVALFLQVLHRGHNWLHLRQRSVVLPGFCDTVIRVVVRKLFIYIYYFAFYHVVIFGQECTINVILGKNVSPGYQYGYITAQGLQAANDPSGFVFSRCTVTGTFKAYLGRAYREYSRVLFIDSYLSDVIVPQGWDAWRAKGKE